MKNFEISEETLNRINDLAGRAPEVQASTIADYCNCTGFGG